MLVSKMERPWHITAPGDERILDQRARKGPQRSWPLGCIATRWCQELVILLCRLPRTLHP